jgi:DNA-binding MarR family transcriptional regulator
MGVVLTDRERRVLYGLVCWPGESDSRLSGRLGLPRSTVTVVRNRLQDEGLFSRVYVPDFLRIGCELLTTLYGEFRGSVERDLEVFRDAVRDGVSTAFYMVSAGGLHLSLGAARNLTEVTEHITNHLKLHHQTGYLTDRRHNYVLFPLKLSRIHRFFDYGPLLASHFGYKHHAKPGEKERQGGKWSPTRRERKIFHALINHPEATDEEAASLSGVSRQTVNAARNRFLKQGLLKVVGIPDIGKLGFQLISFTHLHMNPHHDSKVRKPHVKSVLSDPSHVLKISGDLETILLSVHQDYGGYRASRDKLLGVYKKAGLILEEPATHIFPIDQTDHVVHHDYANLVSNLYSI